MSALITSMMMRADAVRSITPLTRAIVNSHILEDEDYCMFGIK